MKKNLLLIILLFSAIASYCQTKGIVGSWLWRDLNGTISLFIKENGSIEKREATSKESVWSKTPKTGTYTFSEKNNLFLINWGSKKNEKVQVKFVDNGKAAKFQFTDPKNKSKKTFLFLRVVDEEVISDK